MSANEGGFLVVMGAEVDCTGSVGTSLLCLHLDREVFVGRRLISLTSVVGLIPGAGLSQVLHPVVDAVGALRTAETDLAEPGVH